MNLSYRPYGAGASALPRCEAGKKPVRGSQIFLVRSTTLGAAFALVLTVRAAAQDAAPSHDKLAMWAGRWKVHGEVKETQFAHARTFDYDVQCSFLPYGAYMACNYLSLMPDPNHGNRISNGARLFYYSDVDKSFKYTEVFPEGGPREGVALIDGNVWTEPLQVQGQSGGKEDARFVSNFVSADKILARFEISTDSQAHWTVVDEFSYTKAN